MRRASGSLLRAAVRNAMPSIAGMRRSDTMTSKLSPSISAAASSAEVEVVTATSASVTNMRAKARHRLGSSST